jgi:hypothetical protein
VKNLCLSLRKFFLSTGVFTGLKSLLDIVDCLATMGFMCILGFSWCILSIANNVILNTQQQLDLIFHPLGVGLAVKMFTNLNNLGE